MQDTQIGTCFAAHQPNQGSSETQQPIFVDDRERVNVAFQDAVEKCPETGLVAVKTGADVGDDFRATGLLESFCLPKQIFFLIVGRDAGITKVLALDTACHRIQLQIESTVTAKRAAGYGKKAFLSPTSNGAWRHTLMFGNDPDVVQRHDCLR